MGKDISLQFEDEEDVQIVVELKETSITAH
jgi:hypothetical protein